MKAAVTSAAAVMTLPSCDSLVFDGEGDCAPVYSLRFKFTNNVLDADAFGSQVTDIHVAVYDKEGNLLFTQADRRAPTEENEYRMPVDLRPGTYDIIAWCGGTPLTADAVAFALRGQAVHDHISVSGAFFEPQGTDGNRYFQSDIAPLYYGRIEDVTCSENDYGSIDLPSISLTKDTNNIIVMLQNLSDSPLDASLLTFSIEAENSALDWKNDLTAAEPAFDYHPWSVEPVSASEVSDSRAGMPNGVKTEFTTGRLFADHEQRLVVTRNDTGEEIISIPLIEYLLLVRGNYAHAVSAQDYLDRVDSYSLVFFMDENGDWIKSRVLINGWRVVPPQQDTLTRN
ncbi:MAG: FimB/Mfa2 family fimbrial subunit [Muribaculaceae bacterium]|nr:FimB/Mfa2 family fimbrial subunit [Muribaculaceae bacterium]